jgi:hypothetical protein
VLFYEVWDYQIWRRTFALVEEAMRTLDRMPAGEPTTSRREEAH